MAVIGLIQHPEVADKLAKGGSFEVENLKWGYAALRVKDVYMDLLK